MTFVTLRDGTRLRSTVLGEGPDVVLVHGWKQSHRLFDQAIHRLSQSHRVIAFDQRGTGESDRPDCPYTFDLLGADLREILEIHDAADATLVGWSMGCTVVLSSMVPASDRVGRVVLVNGPLRLTRTDDFPYALTEHDLESYVEGMEEAWPADQRAFLEASLLPRNATMTPLLEYVAWQTPLHIALRLVRNQAAIDHRATVEQLTVPVLAAYSIHDPYWPVNLATWIATSAPKGYEHRFTESAHCAPLEEPAEFVRIVGDFVAGRIRD
jgi:non-heme chloroperoxidase